MSTKPVVEFINGAKFIKRTLTDSAVIAEYKQFIDETNSYELATVYAMNHPIFGQQLVRTSIVIKKHSDGSFETMNTIYQPVKEEENV